jgi:hypothetical protein
MSRWIAIIPHTARLSKGSTKRENANMITALLRRFQHVDMGQMKIVLDY